MTEADDRFVERTFVEFAHSLVEHRSVESILNAVADHCTRLLPVAGVGILLVEEGDLTMATANCPEGEAAERLEVELGEGPCVDAVRSGHPVQVPDLRAAAHRWPRFAPRALEAGVRAIYGIPMTGRGELVGSLNIVHTEPVELAERQLAAACVLVDVAVSYIFAVRLHEESSALAGQLQRALDTRVVIEQAKGILAERHKESLAEAFDRVRAHARSKNVTARQVAEEVVASALQL